MSDESNKKGAGFGLGQKKHNDFQKAKNTKGTVLRLYKYLGKHLFKLIFVVIMIILSTAISILGTRCIGIAIDRYISIGDFVGLSKMCLFLLIIYLLSSLSIWIQSKVMVSIAQDTVMELRKDIFDKLQQLPLKFFDTNPLGDTMSRVTNDIDNISTTLNMSVIQVLQSVITIVSTLGMMLYLNIVLTLVILITLPLLFVMTKVITKKSRTYFSSRQKKLGVLNGQIEEIISGQKVVKVFTREEKEIAKFKEVNNDLLDVGIKAEIFSGIINPISMAINNIGYALVATAGGIMIVMNTGMTIGVVSNFVIYSKQFTRPLNELANQINTMMSALAGAERVFEILDEKNEAEDLLNAHLLKEIKGEVVFEDVNFSYEEGRPVLKNINLYALQGQKIAFVGPTGAGKTTVINLLTRFYDIDSGVIKIDGYDIRQLKRSSLNAALGIVLQDTYLFTGTIRDNIAFGRLDATDEEIKEAAKLANANEFIKKLHDGYNTILKDGGNNLSQGQRQMISIARAILANPAILILDEATSSVDTRTEVKIQEAMNNLMKGRTSFVIAHRLSTIKDADLIAVVNGGEIIERGNHRQLLEKKGFYYDLYMSQFCGSEKVS